MSLAMPEWLLNQLGTLVVQLTVLLLIIGLALMEE